MIHESVWIPSSFGDKIKMDVYIPSASKDIDPDIKRPAIVICPGGGYRYCSEREAEPIALRFLSEGFNTFVIWYRVYASEDTVSHDCEESNYCASPKHVWPLPQHDAAAAVAYVRNHAQQWHTDPNQISIMGFSAGGHLAASLSALWQHADMWEILNLTPEEVRPNASVLCYPVIVADKDAHRGSFECLTGNKDEGVHQQFSVLNWVSKDYPPAFIWHTFSDGAVPVQNSLRLSLALTEAGVLNELHVFPYGQHGLSLANSLTASPLKTQLHRKECEIWPDLAARFLKEVVPK